MIRVHTVIAIPATLLATVLCLLLLRSSSYTSVKVASIALQGSESTMILPVFDDLPVGAYGSSFRTMRSGDVIIAGTLTTPEGTDAFVSRLTRDGHLDPSFGVNGVIKFDTGGNEEGRSILVLPDDTILIGGSIFDTHNKSDAFLLKIAPSGAPDRSFGIDGVIRVDVGINETAVDLELVDEHIYVLSNRDVVGTFDSMISCYDLSGKPCPSFGHNGIRAIGYDMNSSSIDMSVTPTDQLVIAGVKWLDGTTNSHDIAVTLLDLRGHVVSTFGKDGELFINLGVEEYPTKVQVQSDGTIILVGRRIDRSSAKSFLAHISALENQPNINSEGSITHVFDLQVDLHSLELTDDDGLVLGGTREIGPSIRAPIVLFRMADGSPDYRISATAEVRIDSDRSGDWRVNDISLSREGYVHLLTAVSEDLDHDSTLVFSPVSTNRPARRLTIQAPGDARHNGTIRSVPAGIECPPVCEATWSSDQTITLESNSYAIVPARSSGIGKVDCLRLHLAMHWSYSCRFIARSAHTTFLPVTYSSRE